MAASDRVGTYVYCVVPWERWRNKETSGKVPIDVRGMGEEGNPVRVVHTEDLAALVSDSPRDGCAISRRNLLAHERVIEYAMASSDVLPVRFGGIASSDQEVHETLLVAQRQRLRELLGLVRGKVELSLKVLWRGTQLFTEIVAEDPVIRGLRDDLAGGASFSRRLTLGQMVERAMVRKQEHEAARLLAALQPLAAATRANPAPLDTMVLNAAFLVDRTKLNEFDKAVDQLTVRDANRLIYRYVGLLPAYSFVSVDPNRQE